jgi:DNA-binding CsgD family transcriptional regulator
VEAPVSSGLRLAEPLAALSLATDLARARPAGEAVRGCLAAVELASELGLSADERSTVYWTALLRSVGCTATSHEYATLLGGDGVAASTLLRQSLDPDAVAAVLEAAGRAAPRRRSYPAGLTEREVEVLRLLAAGLSKKEVARRLVVSPSTVHTHVVHVYEKAGVSTRAGAALFALEHGLLRARESAQKID